MIEYKTYLRSSNDLTDPQAISFCGGGLGLPLSVTVPSTAAYAVDDLVWLENLGDADPGLNEKCQRFNGFAKVVQIFSGTVLKVNKTVQYDIPTTFGTLYKVASIEVFPLNLKECIKEKKRQENEFFYREKITGNIKFVNRPNEGITDYSYLLGIETGANRCSLILLDIYRRCNKADDFTPYYTGQFTLNDGAWNRDDCTYETAIPPADIYACLLDDNKEVNILDIEETVETSAPLEIELEFITCVNPVNEAGLTPNGIVCPTNIFFPHAFPDGGGHAFSGTATDTTCITPGEWQVYEQIYETIVESAPFTVTITTTWFREKMKTLNVGGLPNSPPGAGWYSGAGTDIGGLPATWWYRLPYNGAFNTYKWTTNCGLKQSYETVELPENPSVYSRNRWLFDALEYVARIQCGAVKGVKSDFFEWNPPGDTPGYVAGTNYVTGTPNQYNFLTIAQTSDIITPTSTEAATRGMIKFKKFVDVIKEMFNVGWWIDADNYLRIEHVSVINVVPGLDFTTPENSKWIYRKFKYGWMKDKMASLETYFWEQVAFEDFIGRPIFYRADCLNKKQDESEKRHDCSGITTDLRYLQTNPNEASKTGFVILANEETAPGSGIYLVINDVGVLTQQPWNNTPLSWANLHDLLHRHYRVFITGNMNGLTETFFTIQRFKKQVDFDYEICCQENLIGENITTQVGQGWLDRLTLSLKSTRATITLLFE